MEGSVAIAAQSASRPDALLLALRGSGQALYVGLGEDVFVVASEPYGLVEVSDHYLRMDGETPADPDNPGRQPRPGRCCSTPPAPGTLEGIRRWSYDGTELAVRPGELVGPQITTRDIDRGAFPHFLLKEICESPSSFRKTLRGRLVDGRTAGSTVRLGRRPCPPRSWRTWPRGASPTCVVIGQGTAAVAGQGRGPGPGRRRARRPLRVEAVLATELSGFRLRSDMSDTLVVAISQSGTTTDTNRTVDLVALRGARVISIVNRRQSDLVDRSDGVLYTSDGRDVEMSVASTKAFYSQIAAGFLLAVALAELAVASALGRRPSDGRRARSGAAGRAGRAPRPHGARRSSCAPRSPTPPASSRRRGATGPSSATAPTASPPTRCASSCRSSATSRSPATAPRTRSTSICPPSR